MPIKSKAQQRLLFAKERAGELPEGTALKMARETKEKGVDLKSLPEKVSKTAATIFDAFIKEATIGANTATARAGVQRVRPSNPGKVVVPDQKVIGTSRGFKPEESSIERSQSNPNPTSPKYR